MMLPLFLIATMTNSQNLSNTTASGLIRSPSTDIRLVGGSDLCSGRVEVQVQGVWGTVCDDDWDLNDAQVACRQMGCGRALSAPSLAHFGPGTGQIWLDNLGCSGTESSLFECRHNGLGTHNCGHGEDAGVVCEHPEPNCGENLTMSGSFFTPFYPNDYHENAFCVWTLSAPVGQKILLTFLDLEIESCCTCDYITVFDGPTVGDTELARLCNTSSLGTFQSTSNQLTVVFRSDQFQQSRGFMAEFISFLPSDMGEVQCTSDYMKIILSTSLLSSHGYNETDIYVNDELCRPSVIGSSVVFYFATNRCGTVMKSRYGQVIYHNTVRGNRTESGVITRQSQLMLSVACYMERESTLQIMYEARDTAEFNIAGIGPFNTVMAFFTSETFNQEIFTQPYEVALNDSLYVQIKLSRYDSRLVLFLDMCVASPSPHDNTDQDSYYLVVNGCPSDNTFHYFVNGSQSVVQYRFQAFEFLRTNPIVYLRCKVLICPADDTNSRCRQGCRTRRPRSLSSQHITTTMVLGPIRLKD